MNLAERIHSSQVESIKTEFILLARLDEGGAVILHCHKILLSCIAKDNHMDSQYKKSGRQNDTTNLV